MFLFLARAQALEVRAFCFKQHRAQHVYLSIKDLLLPKDNAEVMGDCLHVAGTETRLDVIEALIARQFPYSRMDQGGSQATSKQCNLQLEKRSRSDQNTRSLDLGARNDWRDNQKKSDSTETSSLVLSAGKQGSIRYDDKQLYITCHPRGENYELEFSFSHERGGTSTTVTLSKGQQINVGSVVKDLNGSNRDLSISKGISTSKTTGAEQADYFLSVR